MELRPPLSRSSTATTRSTIDMGGIKPRLSLPTKIGRDCSPGLQWHKEYTSETLKRPRCLMIDYAHKEAGVNSRKVSALEIHDMHTFKRACIHTSPAIAFNSVNAEEKKAARRDDSTGLRVFHVQNWPEATRFMDRKYRLHEDDALTGQSGFLDWIMQERPQQRAGKPLLMGKTWGVSSDPWRRVTKCAVSLDIMKRYRCCISPQEDHSKETRITGLMGYDHNDNPVLHSNVHTQRTSVYVQYSFPDIQTPGPDVVSPYSHNSDSKLLDEVYDNGNTIIIFDNSDSGSINDTLIPARGEWESRWRRLPFYLSTTQGNLDTDEEQMTGACMRRITQDIFKAVAESWDELLDASWEHVSILEDKIYEHPADESHAPELWRNQAKWLVYEKLMYGHQDAITDWRKHLVELDGDLSDEGQWLKEAPADFQRLGNLIEEDLAKRTNNLSELMYKSVAIRDGRESLRLGASMWRLSWITFIFLPLTFLVSFFGMNVDTFSGNPSMKWYFITAIPFMLFIFIFWYLLKHWFTKSRYTPLQHGTYEALFTELQMQRPDIWTRQGPREYIQPRDMVSRWKWRLITRWAAGGAVPRTADDDPIGGWNKIKRYFIRRWTGEIRLAQHDVDIEAQGESNELISGVGRMGGTLETVAVPTAAPMAPEGLVLVVEEDPGTGSKEEEEVDSEPAELSDGRNSGVLVEERSGGAPVEPALTEGTLGMNEVYWANGGGVRQGGE